MSFRNTAVGRFVYDNDWAIAAGLTVFGLVLAIGLVGIDHLVDLNPQSDRPWLYGGDASSAASLLSVISSSMIAVAGIIFSVNFVAVQLASSLYTPRVIRTMTRKRWLQVVLGAFLATFVYSLVVLRSIQPETENDAEFVPVLSVSVSILFALCCVAVLIYFVHQGARLVQPASLIEAAAQESVRIFRETPDVVAREEVDVSPDPHRFDLPSVGVPAVKAGYIQSIDGDVLLQVAKQQNLVIHIDRLVGEMVLQGEEVATVWPETAVDGPMLTKLQGAWRFGSERTPEQDAEFGFRRVADIALKAMSPAINDPTTTMTCIDSLCALLVSLAQEFIAPYQRDEEDIAAVPDRRVIWTSRMFDRCADISFTQVRHYAAADPVVMSHLLDMMGRVARLVPSLESEIVTRHAVQARESALAAIRIPADRQRIEQAAKWIDGGTSLEYLEKIGETTSSL